MSRGPDRVPDDPLPTARLWDLPDIPLGRAFLVGRHPSADLVLDVPTVSVRHLSVRRTPAGWEVTDLGSTNGTFLNRGDRPVVEPTLVDPKDVLLLGSFRLPVSLMLRKLGVSDTEIPDDFRVSVGREPLVLGRATDCDLVIPFPQVSARHARVTLLPTGQLLVEDLGSTNGTFVDGRRIRRAVVQPGSHLSLASVPVVLEADHCLRASMRRGTVRLDAVGVTRVVRHRVSGRPVRLLDDVHVSIYPSELVGIMGPSGAGKTTLLLALNGYEPPDEGRVLITGEDLYDHFDRFRGLIGYVPQDDIIHRALTVRESLQFTARLRLPADTTRQEIDRRISQVLADLRLVDQADEIIGSIEEKVLSGGQRKRVNLAQELITDPDLLLLDEPTSGLSARDTADVMDLLRAMADRGRTVVLTIHQPSAEVYRKMDQVLLMAQGGKVAFFGPTEPDSYDFMGVRSPSPDQILDRLEDARPEEWTRRYRGSPQYRTYVLERQGSIGDPEARSRPVRRRHASPFRQLGVLLHRYGLVKARDRGNAWMMLFQAPIVGSLIGWLFRDAREDPLKRGAPLFVMVIATIFFACFNACREIVAERAIFRRERMVNLGIGPYLLSKFLVLGAVDGLQVLLLLALVGWSTGLEGSWSGFLLVLWFAALASTAMGLLISTVVRSSEAAMAMVPIVLIPQIVLAGFIVPLDRADVETPASLVVSRWANEAMMHLEAEGIEQGRGSSPRTPPSSSREDRPRSLSEHPSFLPAAPEPTFRRCFLESKKLQGGRPGTDLSVILGFLALFLGTASYLLARRDRR
ncbi:MAG TPA: ATP-binding cassette domain-containing protein [Myxococcota bacterium]|nr:ATP-binding cassette domain-containing protein [Myxococcota bacterium]HQK50444.1 ATP-binding cassette domain-containing protein [Myxococcota bacterium]